MKFENIREIKNKKGLAYRVFIHYGKSPNRKVYSKTFNVSDFANKTECINYAKTHRDIMKIQLGLNDFIEKDNTLKEVFELRCSTCLLSPETIRKYKTYYNKIIKTLDENTPFKKINYFDIVKSFEPLIDTCTQYVIDDVYTLWKQLYKTAITHGIVNTDLSLRINKPKSKKPIKHREVKTTIQNIKDLCNSLPDTDYASLVKLAIMIMYYTGIRPAECFALEDTDFNLEDMTLHINKAIRFDKDRKPFISTTKTSDSVRFVPLDINILPYLKNLPKGFIFSPNDNLMYAEKVNSYIRKYYKGFTLYQLRHYFATDLIINQGIDVTTVQSLMGHSEISTTLSYAKTDENVMRNALKNRSKI